MLTRRVFLLATMAAGFDPDTVGLAAEIYPSRTIKLIVPFPPGTASELISRIVADRLSSKFGHPIIVENRPGGAGGTVGAAAVASAEPDGYTLLVSPPGPLVTAGTLYKNLGYDPGSSFTPVAPLFSSPQLLAVHPSVPTQSIGELIVYCRSNPGRIAFASPGYGTQPHLLGDMFKATAGLDIVHVPYKGPAQAVTDLLAGQVQIYFESAPLILSHAVAGKLRVIAVAGQARIRQLPDVPTTIESGFPKLVGGYWAGVLAPSGTPRGIVDRLNVAINEAMQSPDVQVTLAKLGAEAMLGSPGEFALFIAAETQKWSAVIKAAGIKID